jgi:hypothetical protein
MVGVLISVVYEPGDIILALPSMAVCAAVFWRRRVWLVGIAVLALVVPFAHLYSVDQVLKDIVGQRVALAVDGVAIVLAWLCLVATALRSPPGITDDNRISVEDEQSTERP